MSRFVVDTSVAVKWFVSEPHSQEARMMLVGDHELLVPDLLFPEFGNVLWKRVRNGEMTEGEASAVLDALLQIPLRVHSSGDLVIPALEIANRTQCTVYDSLYLALALRDKALLVTADSHFLNSLRPTPLAAHLIWVEDLINW